MCRIDERVYVRADGHRSVFQDTTHCERGRRLGKVCNVARIRTTIYPVPTSSPVASSPLTPVYDARACRLPTSARPSTRDGPYSALKPEIVIEIGSRLGLRKAVTFETEKEKGPVSPGTKAALADASDSEVSHIPRSIYSDGPPSDMSTAGSSRIASLYHVSDDDDIPSLATSTVAAPSRPRPVIHSGPRPVSSSDSPSNPYRSATLTPLRTDFGSRNLTIHRNRQSSPYAPEIISRDEDRPRRRDEQRRRQEAHDAEVVANLLRYEEKQADFEDAIPMRSVKHPVDKALALRDEAREQLRQQHRIEAQATEAADREAAAAREAAAKKQNPSKVIRKPSRRTNARPSPTRAAERQRLLEAEAQQMREERIKLEAHVREEQLQQQQHPLLLSVQQQDSAYYDARGGTTLLHRGQMPVSRRNSLSGSPVKALVSGIKYPPHGDRRSPVAYDNIGGSEIGLSSNEYLSGFRARDPGSPRSLGYDEDDSVSTGSKYAASIFSVESLATDATGLSQASGYSQIQIVTATKALINILQDDEMLVPLYKRAVASTVIGPERLQRNLYRLFKQYARDLGKDYAERLEYLASRLVAIRARYLAKSIVDKYRPSQSRPPVDVPEAQDSGEDSSDDDVGASPVEDKDFDLQMFRQFLVESNAFVTLRAEIQTFVVPKTPTKVDASPINSPDCIETFLRIPRVSERGTQFPRTWRVWREYLVQTIDAVLLKREVSLAAQMAVHLIPDALMLATDKMMIATGLLEPPLSPGLTRLRWTCDCGDSLFSDVAELQADGIKDLIALMEASAGAKVVATPYRHYPSSQQYTGLRHLHWFGGGPNSSQTTQQRTLQPAPTQPSTSNESTNTSTTGNSSVVEGTLLHLMACVHDKGSDKILLQDRIKDVTTDRALIQFLRSQYRRHRSRLRSFLSLKCVQGIHFVRFHLPLGDSVIIIPHETTCLPGIATSANQTGTAACECLPPRTRVEPLATAEYKCRPVPPKTFPPIPPEYLLSFFTCRKEPHEASRWMIEQFPKRSWGELFGGAEQPAEGWGIYYKEGWDPRMIARFVLGLLLVSLVFGAVWSKEKEDIQGAFGVASWIVGVGGALLAVLVTSVNNL